MPKFYVQSGNVRTVISADDAEKAALWAVHCAMRQIIPVDEDEASPEDKSRQLSVAGVRVLGPKVSVSETGFDRSESLHLDTIELVVHWNQLMLALARLESLACPSAAL